MKPSEILKPGMVGVNIKGRLDALGTFDTWAQGDTDGAHVWWVLPSGKIATTGAKAMVFYGEVDADEYLRGKSCYLLETIDPLAAGQLAIMQACHNELMRSGPARLYGIWKFAVIGFLAILHGGVDKTGFKATSKRPTCPICSQAVAYCFWMAGVPVGKEQGKEDWTAVLPETFIKEAKQDRYMIENGFLSSHSKPCYMLQTVKDTPFQF